MYHRFSRKGIIKDRNNKYSMSPYVYGYLLYAHSRGAIRCPVWNTSHTVDFMIHVRGDATLTIGPYGSAGTDANFNKW